jgi:polysaccharide chain length determinant protein (PEP-CTERM system associated)
MNVDPGIQLDLLGALQRRLPMIVTAVGVGVLAGYWIAMALPNYYNSAATIFVEPQVLNKKLVESGSGGHDIGYRLSLMTAQILSRPRLSRVIDDLNLYPEESKTMLREEVIGLLRSRISVLPAERASIAGAGGPGDPGLSTFVVAFTDKSPQVAAEVAQRVANDFVKEHIEERVGMTRKSLEFIESELERLNTDYSAVQDEVTRVKNANSGRLPDDQAANQRVLDRIVGELRGGQRVLDVARGNKAFWDAQVVSAATVSDPSDAGSPGHRLQILELELTEYRSRGFTDRHPDVIQAEQEIADVRGQIESVEDEEALDRTPTLAQQTAEAQRERAALDVEMAVKEIERLRTSADAIEQRLAETPKVAERLGQLENQSNALYENVRLFSSRQMAAKVHVDVERRQLGEQFNILEPAFAASAPSSPNRALIVVMGLIAGLAIGVSGAVLLEAMDSSFRVVRDVQSAFSIPVLATIPEIVLESDRAATHRKLVRQLVAAVSVVLFCLVGGALTYFYVNGVPAWLSSAVEGDERGEEAPAAGGVRWSPVQLG